MLTHPLLLCSLLKLNSSCSLLSLHLQSLANQTCVKRLREELAQEKEINEAKVGSLEKSLANLKSEVSVRLCDSAVGLLRIDVYHSITQSRHVCAAKTSRFIRTPSSSKILRCFRVSITDSLPPESELDCLLCMSYWAFCVHKPVRR